MEKIVKRNMPLPALIKILLFMYVITGVLLLVLTSLLYKMQLSEGIVSIGIVLIYIVSGIVGGILCGKKIQNRKFLWGMAIGAAYFLILMFGSVIFHQGFSMEISRFVTTLILCTASGMVGGMMS